MQSVFQIKKATAADLPAILELLNKNKLPLDDIASGQQPFWVAKEGGILAGAIGLEQYAEYGLLRSMATNSSFRNRGVAGLLIDELFEYAKQIKLREIYLLTETAEKYFEKKGFQKINRDGVPPQIKVSKEFSHLCSSSAVVMKKQVFKSSPSGDGGKKKVLFVCVENSNRSQMSQAFASLLGGDGVDAYSAGSNPSGIINPKAISAMNELGYDLSKHHSKSLKEVEQYAPFDAVVTMGCGDACPWMPAKKFIDWEIPDPKNMGPDEFNKVRDLIKEKVNGFLASL